MSSARSVKSRSHHHKERRHFERQRCLAPVRFAELDGSPVKRLHIAKSKNVSEGGIKITCIAPMHRSAVALLDFNLNVLTRHIKKSKLLLVSHHRVLATVAWRSLNLETGLFDIGLTFVHAGEKKKFQAALKRAQIID